MVAPIVFPTTSGGTMAKASEAKPDSTNEPRPYVVWEASDDNKTWTYLGVYETVTNEAARKAAASDGEADGEPRTGNFFAAALSSVHGESYVKALKPSVDKKPLSLLDPPEEEEEKPPAKANGRSRKAPTPTPTPEPEPAAA